MAYGTNGGVAFRRGWKTREATLMLETERVRLVWTQWRYSGCMALGSTLVIELDMVCLKSCRRVTMMTR